MTTVTLGKSLEEIGNEAFQDCLNIKEVYSRNPKAPNRFSNPFNTRLNQTAVMYIPVGSYNSYLTYYGIFFKEFIEKNF